MSKKKAVRKGHQQTSVMSEEVLDSEIRHAYIGMLESDVNEMTSRLQHVEEVSQIRYKHIEWLEQHCAGLDSSLADAAHREAVLAADNDRILEELEAIRGDLDHWRKEASALASIVDAMQKSQSWRYTRILRREVNSAEGRGGVDLKGSSAEAGE